MEQVYPATNEKGEYYLYDDNGKGVTNQKTLRSIAEGQKLIAEWEKRIESYHLEEIFGDDDEEDGEIDTEGENS